MRAEEIAVLRRENPHGGPDKIRGHADTGSEQINERQGEKHPDKDEAREVALDLISLAHECDRGADCGDIKDRRGLAPRCRFISAQENENAECLTQDQRRESDRATDRPAKKIPVVRDEQDHTGADK